MSYLSCDMSYKISANGASHSTGKNSNQYNRGPRDNHKGIKGYFQYLAREIDVENGQEIYGYHDSIDRSKTLKNQTFFKDMDNDFLECSSVDDLYDAYERRINDVEVKRHLNGKDITLKGKKALRSNSCVLRPIVIQADGHEDTQFFVDAVIKLAEQVGYDNIIGFSIHRDEKSTHCHVLVVPVKEHSLDQQKVLPNTGKKMENFHKTFRKNMKKKYNDISLENKPDAYKNENGKTEDLTQEQNELWDKVKMLAKDFESFRNLEDILNNMYDDVLDVQGDEDTEFVRIAKSMKNSNGTSLYDMINRKFNNEQRAIIRRKIPEVDIQDNLVRMSIYNSIKEDEEDDEYGK